MFSVNNRNRTVRDVLEEFAQGASSIEIVSGYVTPDGVAEVRPILESIVSGGGAVRILTSTELSQDDAEALSGLQGDLPRISIRVFTQAFLHAKQYVFVTAEEVRCLVGSSNLTHNGLVESHEQNTAYQDDPHDAYIQAIRRSFHEWWEQSISIGDFNPPSQARSVMGGSTRMLEEEEIATFEVGTRVQVYGELGQVIKKETFGAGATRYTIRLDSGRERTVTSPPTTLVPVRGALGFLSRGECGPEIEWDFLTWAKRLSTAYNFDRMVSLNSSRVNLEPYQVEAVHRVISTFPHRFLLADDTGLGKTIEAGLILEELAARGRCQRVLVVCPAALVPQWKRELGTHFGRQYHVYDGLVVRQLLRARSPEQNPWELEPRIVTSIDYAKRDEVRAMLDRVRWDMVIVDECHRLGARLDGTSLDKSKRYELGEILAATTDSMLLLSGTPHNGNPSSFQAILALLDEFAFPSPNLVAEDYELDPSQVDRVAIRRTKGEILDANGAKVFVRRDVQTLPTRFETPEERKLYREMTKYLEEGFGIATTQASRTYGFVMTLFQKRMVSSIEGVRRSLLRRRDTLKNWRKKLDKLEGALPAGERLQRIRDYFEDPESLTDDEREEIGREIEGLPATLDPKQLDAEIATLEALCKTAATVTVDSKAEKLLAFLGDTFRQDATEKVLVFTEYRDTLDHLVSRVKARGWRFAQIHGAMSEEEREAALEKFEEPETRVLLATDAAGEGLNLHWSCHLMVNNELPWNPARIEQRIGRLHRYGQKREVRVYNLFVQDSREDRVLESLLEKLATVGRELPGDPYDIIGVLLQQIDIATMCRTALMEDTPIEKTVEDEARAMTERVEMMKKVNGDLFLDLRKYDHSSAMALFERITEASVTNVDLRRLGETFLTSYGVSLKRTRDAGVVEIASVPAVLSTRPKVQSVYRRATFQREVAANFKPGEVDFIAFGHPLFEAIIEHCTRARNEPDGLTALKRVACHGLEGRAGVLFQLDLRYTDGVGGEVFGELLEVVLLDDSSPVPIEQIQLPTFLSTSQETVKLGAAEEVLLTATPALFEKAQQMAIRHARGTEERVQQQQLERVARLRQDLDKYVSAREALINMRRAESERRLWQYKQEAKQLRLGEGAPPEREDIRIVAEQTRIDGYNRDLQELQRKVLERRDELESMEIVGREPPELVNIAILHFVDREELAA